MSFIFASSHLPETRVQRPEDEEEDDVQPMLHSGGVRAFSHLPAKRQAADPAGPLSQRGAQALGRQFQRTEPEGPATSHEDGISAAKASGVFDAVRQQFNRDDSPHFMDENGNLRPRDEARQPDSSSPRDPRSPQFGAGAPPRPAWSAAHTAAADSSRSPRTSSPVPDDTRPWYMPAITPEDLDPQHSDDGEAAGSHSALNDRPEAHDLVYRTPGASTPKPGFQDLVYRYNGSPEEAKDHNRDYFKNTAATADGRGHLAQQSNTYGAAPDNRGNGSSYGHADNAGSGSQPAATAPSTYKPYRSIFQDVMDGHKKYEPEAEPTVEMLEQKEKALELQAEGARQAQHQQLEALENLRELRMFMEGTKAAQDFGKKKIPKRFRKPFDRFNDRLGLSPEQIIAKIDADIEKRQNELLKYYEEVEKANMALHQAKMETAAAKKKKELETKQKEEQMRKELEEKQKAEQLRRELEEKQKQSWQSPRVLG